MGDLFAAAGQGGLFAARGFLFPLHCVQEKLKKREKNLEGFENYRKCSKAGGIYLLAASGREMKRLLLAARARNERKEN